MNVGYLEEPLLEFGSGTHVDIRRGLIEHGPFDIHEPLRPESIRIGLVGTTESIAEAKNWLIIASKGLAAKESKKPNLFPAFPGFSSETAFRSSLVFDSSLTQALPIRLLAEAGGILDISERLNLT